MALQQFEHLLEEIAHAVAGEAHQAHLPICVSVWYSDGLCWQLPLACNPSHVAEMEPALREALQLSLARAQTSHCVPVCLTIWFSDRSCIQRGLPPSTCQEPARADDLSQCKQDLLSVLKAAGQRLTTTAILKETATRELHWGESTLKRALAEMVRDGELTNRPDLRPRGYGLPDW